jgi:hypothetical protein
MAKMSMPRLNKVGFYYVSSAVLCRYLSQSAPESGRGPAEVARIHLKKCVFFSEQCMQLCLLDAHTLHRELLFSTIAFPDSD